LVFKIQFTFEYLIQHFYMSETLIELILFYVVHIEFSHYFDLEADKSMMYCFLIPHNKAADQNLNGFVILHILNALNFQEFI
jgi:hypothetical protein